MEGKAMRVSRALAVAGVASRRAAERLVLEGRVLVNGEPAAIGQLVEPTDRLEVDGTEVRPEPLRAYLLNKAAGTVATASDPQGRPTVLEGLPEEVRLYPVGRLDLPTTGALIVTNDGDLAHRLMHPRYGVLKTYLADVPGPVERDLGRRLTAGIELEDGVASADRFRVVERAGSRALVEVTLHEGRKHIVRRLLAAAGHPVSRLVRTQVGPVSLGNLRPGTSRVLTTAEVGALYAAVGL
jgi:pseudouridine synthase